MTDQRYVTQSQGIDPPAQLTNMRLGLATMLECQDAGDGSPRLGLFYGPSGYGKSYAAAAISARLGAAYVVAQSIWTQRTLLEAIARELGIPKLERTGPRLLAQIVDQLLIEPVPLIIDEMDHLVKKQSVEIIRDIHDGARVPVLMIGEESLPAKLKEWERFDNRILVARPAEPSTIADALLLRDYYSPRVAIADDLVAAIVEATKGVTRRIVVNLQNAQNAAIGAGTDAITLADWQAGGRRFATGALTPAAEGRVMREPTTDALRKLLVTLTRGDVVAPYSHLGLTILEQRKQVASYMLFQPNGRLAKSKRWVITEQGRDLLQAGR